MERAVWWLCALSSTYCRVAIRGDHTASCHQRPLKLLDPPSPRRQCVVRLWPRGDTVSDECCLGVVFICVCVTVGRCVRPLLRGHVQGWSHLVCVELFLHHSGPVV